MHRLLIVGAVLLGQEYLQDSKISSIDDIMQYDEKKVIATTEVIPGGEVEIIETEDFAELLPEEEEGVVDQVISDAGEKIKDVTTDIVTSEKIDDAEEKLLEIQEKVTDTIETVKEKAEGITELVSKEEDLDEQIIPDVPKKRDEYLGPEIESGITSEDIRRLRAEVEKEILLPEEVTSFEEPSVFEKELEEEKKKEEEEEKELEEKELEEKLKEGLKKEEEVLITEKDIKDLEKIEEVLEEAKIAEDVEAIEKITEKDVIVPKKEEERQKVAEVKIEEKKEDVKLVEPKKAEIPQKKIIEPTKEGEIVEAKKEEIVIEEALKESEKEAQKLYLTEEEELELLLGLSEEEDIDEIDVPHIIPREKEQKKFVNENIPKALLSFERSRDNQHIPFIFNKRDMVKLAFVAIREDDTAKLRSIVKNLRDPNIFNKQNGETALTYATKNKSYNSMKFLIYYGADINMQNNKLEAPIHIAVKQKDHIAMNMLIERSANLDVKNVFKKTSLMLAIETEQSEMIKKLVDMGANVNLMNIRGETALDIARRMNIRPVVTFLLANGAIESRRINFK
ncbi:ankyrin repeat domain-containing protein [Pseudomonadota bacterium]